jgi:hypothetical protein
VVASLTTKALRNVHQFESLVRRQQDTSTHERRGELQRVALLSFLRKLLERYERDQPRNAPDTMLAKASDEELERLVGVAMQVFEEEAKS